GVREPAAKPLVDAVRERLEAYRRRVDAWSGLGAEDLELDARPAADLLYHLLAAGLLLGEGQALCDRSRDFRKFAAAALYARRWLDPPPPGAPRFASADLQWLDSLADWTPVPEQALTGRR
ncbi:MAG TPA: hypothetical protein VEL75_21875, partial [Candidatus Methylomirabilis sp.]|nr:hypothetical protein [Candidatus Methylomirabilis sp.]